MWGRKQLDVFEKMIPNFDLNSIYDRTSGKCHLCHKKFAFRNYGFHGARGSWEVEHSRPQSRGGTHHPNNLFAACISCNRSKGAKSTRSMRAANGRSRAPLSVAKRRSAQAENALLGASSGALLGGKFAGPVGALVGGIIGAVLGHDSNADD